MVATFQLMAQQHDWVGKNVIRACAPSRCWPTYRVFAPVSAKEASQGRQACETRPAPALHPCALLVKGSPTLSLSSSRFW